MKKNQTNNAVNKQEDKDTEAYILHPEHAIADTKQEKPRQFTAGSKEKTKHKRSDHQIQKS